MATWLNGYNHFVLFVVFVTRIDPTLNTPITLKMAGSSGIETKLKDTLERHSKVFTDNDLRLICNYQQMSQVVGKGEVYRAHRAIEAYLLGVCSAGTASHCSVYCST